MISIRNRQFETNSSSVHVLVIPKDTNILIPKVVTLTGGEYGWENEEYWDTLNYFYQACVDAGRESVAHFFAYLRRKGIEEMLDRMTEMKAPSESKPLAADKETA